MQFDINFAKSCSYMPYMAIDKPLILKVVTSLKCANIPLRHMYMHAVEIYVGIIATCT